MEDVAAKEKRAIPRFVLELPVMVTVASGEQIEAAAKTRDISSHGICFECNAAMERESVIEFTLTLPTEVTMTEPIRVRCRGTVVRVESKAAGKFSIAASIESYEFIASEEPQLFGAETEAPQLP